MPPLALGFHTDVSAPQYHADESVSAGVLCTVLDRCPFAGMWDSYLNIDREPDEPSAAMERGTIAHALLLEGATPQVVEIDPNQFPAKTTGAIPEAYTNPAIRRRRDEIRAAGKIPVLPKQMAGAKAIAEAAREFLTRAEDDAVHKAFLPDGGDSEATLIWEEDGVRCRIRPDRISKDRKIIVDYKTTDTSAEPNTWGRALMIRLRYYVAAAFYRRGVRAVCGVDPEYVFLVQECSAPYLCSLVGVDQVAMRAGDQQIEWALAQWRKCLKAKSWPAYPSRVCYPEFPPWATQRVEEHETQHSTDVDAAKVWPQPVWKDNK